MTLAAAHRGDAERIVAEQLHGWASRGALPALILTVIFVGGSAYHASAWNAGLHEVAATVVSAPSPDYLTAGPGGTAAEASWEADGHVRTARIPVPVTAVAGAVLPVTIDSAGNPVRRQSTAGAAVAGGLLVANIIGMVVAGAHWLWRPRRVERVAAELAALEQAAWEDLVERLRA